MRLAMVAPPTPPFWRIAVVENYIDLSCLKVCLLCLLCRFVVKKQQNVYVCTIPGITSLWCIYVASLFHQFIGKNVCTFPPNHGHDMGKACKYCKHSLLKGAPMWDILITDTGWQTSANTYSRTFSIFYLSVLTFRHINPLSNYCNPQLLL